MLVDSALYDMERAGVNPALLSVGEDGDMPNAHAKLAVTTWCKANFGYDNAEAARFEASYDRILNSLLNSAENVAAIAAQEAEGPTSSGESTAAGGEPQDGAQEGGE